MLPFSQTAELHKLSDRGLQQMLHPGSELVIQYIPNESASVFFLVPDLMFSFNIQDSELNFVALQRCALKE